MDEQRHPIRYRDVEKHNWNMITHLGPKGQDPEHTLYIQTNTPITGVEGSISYVIVIEGKIP